MKTTAFITKFFFLAALVSQSTTMLAQQQHTYSYQYYNTSHGLPSPEINSLAKDAKGFLWIGTSSGLSMYDGYNFKNYSYSNDGQLIGHVNVVKADADNRLWIGSAAGLFCFAGNDIIKVSATGSLPQGINDILPGQDGSIWLATENGPVKLPINNIDFSGKKKTRLTEYLLKQWDVKSENIDNRRATIISKAPDNTIFIARYHDLFRYTGNQLQLVHTTTDSRNKILSVFPLSKSTIYIDAASTEISKLENGTEVPIPFKELYKPGTTVNGPGTWYVGTRGAFCFHPQLGIASAFIDFSDRYSVWPVAVLPDANFLWAASHDGLIRLKPSIFTMHTADNPSYYNDYYSVEQLRNGRLVFGSNRGRMLEMEGNSLHLLKEKPVPSAEIKDMYEDDNGWLWIASGYQGLVLLRNGKTERFTVENGLHDNSLNHLFKSTRGRLYVLGDEGMSEIIVDDKQNISFKRFYYQPNTSQYAKFFSAVEAPDGSIWTGGEEGLFYLRNDSLHKFEFSSKQLYVNYIIKDKEGTVWIATSGEGILQCEFTPGNGLQLKNQFSEKDGLNTSQFLTLLADHENNIWAGSSKGVSVICRNGKYNNRILNFDESDGFIKAGYSYIRLYEAENRIWAVSVFGVASFIPGQLLRYDPPPVVYISGVRQLQGNQVIAETPFNQYPQKDRFGYLNNSFNFTFMALDYSNQENIRYYYKLEGLDTNWTNSGGQRSTSFENLPPGNYIFRVKALNSKSAWSKQDAVYSFSITPPFWKTTWFIPALIIGIGLVALLVARKRIQLVKNREKAEKQIREKEMEVLRLSKDFATSQLTALRMQMNPHFIFNALNSVQHYILQGNVVEANKYLSKFSKLQREILHCSSQQFITLEKEIEILSRYLELEQYRVGESFSWKINMTEEIEPVEIKIPPMVLQPFVENAIWHGLMPRPSERTLTIYFDLFSDDILQVTLRDNGIGRYASAKLKESQAGGIKTEHESKGMSMVQQRLQLLQQQYGKPFEAVISDITDLRGTAQGTQVTLRIYIGDKQS